MTAVAEIVIPYTPRPLQKVLHAALESHRFSVAVCHRRFGKTVLAVNQLIKCALLCQLPRPRYAYIAPFRNQAKDIAWNYLKHYTAVIPDVQVNETELRVDLPTGASIRIYGADNEDALRGIYLDGVVLDEYGLMSTTIWGEVLRPLLSDRQGWAFFIGTPNGRNQFYELIHGNSEWIGAKQDPAWFYTEYRASESGVLPQAELDDARRTMTTDQYLQEYECSFEAAIKGAVFARELQQARESGRITRVAHEPLLAVDTAWDLGMDDATAIWFSQSVPGGEIRLLGYYENRGLGLNHYVGILRDTAVKWGFVYGDHFLPHDVEVKELGTGVSRLETLRSLGLNAAITVAKMPLSDGISATRMLLPKCWFNETACVKGLDALRNYRWRPDTANPTSDSQPVHDWASHGADALRTLACAPRRVEKLLAQGNQARKDRDPSDRRYSKGRYAPQGTGRRGGAPSGPWG
jgi:phage terminase large subunit